MERNMASTDQVSTELSPRAEIIASVARKITFASQQNDVAIIADLQVVNHQEFQLENLELILESEPPLVGAKVWKIDRLNSSSELRIRDRSVSLSGGMLSNLNERLKANLRLSLKHNSEIIAELSQEIIGLARKEWGGASHMPELLGAFVMPNDPVVGLILKQAGEVLRSAGEQPALDGYQSKSRKRVWTIASAIWTSLISRRLVYAEPPVGFETEGQRIRTPGEIYNTGLATCLDTATLFSAALEQAGLNPIIVLIKGHALCGVWLQPQELPALTTEDSSDLRKYLALKELILFETTMAISEPPVSFSKAIAEGERRVSEKEEANFVYALDIKRARRQQITPIGIQVNTNSSNEGERAVEGIQALEASPELPCFDYGLDAEAKPETPETRLEAWKRKLLDLTKRNRLFDLKQSKTAIRIICPNPAFLEDKLADGRKITIIPLVKLSGEAGERDASLFQGRTGEDYTKVFAEEALERDEVVSDLGQGELDAGLVELYRKARLDLEEGGANTLFLALGMLKWKQSPTEERSYRAPLLLVPVKLERASAASKTINGTVPIIAQKRVIGTVTI